MVGLGRPPNYLTNDNNGHGKQTRGLLAESVIIIYLFDPVDRGHWIAGRFALERG